MRLAALLLLATAAVGFFPAASGTSRLPLPVRGVAAGEVRLGSSPPSCYRKCSDCSPCTAVQVPAAAGGGSSLSASCGSCAGRGDLRLAAVTFPSYKPLGWKCRCRDRLYDP